MLPVDAIGVFRLIKDCIHILTLLNIPKDETDALVACLEPVEKNREVFALGAVALVQHLKRFSFAPRELIVCSAVHDFYCDPSCKLIPYGTFAVVDRGNGSLSNLLTEVIFPRRCFDRHRADFL